MNSRFFRELFSINAFIVCYQMNILSLFDLIPFWWNNNSTYASSFYQRLAISLVFSVWIHKNLYCGKYVMHDVYAAIDQFWWKPLIKIFVENREKKISMLVYKTWMECVQIVHMKHAAQFSVCMIIHLDTT